MRLLDFSGIAIPDNAAADTILSTTRTNLVTLRGGVIDNDGGKSFPECQEYGREGWFINDMDNSIDALKQRMLQGAGVLRAKMRDESVRITLAKITQLVTNADVNTYSAWQPFTIRFQQTYPYWMSEDKGWFFDSGYTFDTGNTLDWTPHTYTINANPFTFTVTNGSNVPVPMIFIHVACGATDALNSFILYNETNNMAFHYQTALGNNQRLIVDTLARAVSVNYAPAYAGFGLEDESQTNWMQLEPGANNFRLIYNSKTNSPTISFYYLKHYL